MIFFDNDGTLNPCRSCWEYFHRHFGTWEPDACRLQKILLSERTPYDEYCHQTVKLMSGVPREKFLERIRTIEPRPGALQLIQTLKNAGIKLAVLSAGLSIWRDVWRERDGVEWDYYQANEVIFDENGLCTGEIEINVTDNVDGMDKGDWVERIAEKEGISIEERVFIGDGWGDVPGFRKCGISIAIDPNMDEVKNAADYILDGNEILKVLEIIISA